MFSSSATRRVLEASLNTLWRSQLQAALFSISAIVTRACVASRPLWSPRFQSLFSKVFPASPRRGPLAQRSPSSSTHVARSCNSSSTVCSRTKRSSDRQTINSFFTSSLTPLMTHQDKRSGIILITRRTRLNRPSRNPKLLHRSLTQQSHWTWWLEEALKYKEAFLNCFPLKPQGYQVSNIIIMR